MTFNKWHPDRAVAPRRGFTAEGRARLMRVAWYASTLMLVAGYVMAFLLWDA